MTKKHWILIAIIVAVILGLIMAVKYIPVWITILNLAMFSAGFVFGYFLNKKKNNNGMEANS